MIASDTFGFLSLKKTVLFFVLLFLIIGTAFSQTDDKFYVQFTDKNNSPFSIQQPQLYLSQKSIDRRAKQSISINESDLPVNPNYLAKIKQLGATVLYPLKWMNGAVIQTSSSQILDSVLNLSFVSLGKTVNRIRPLKKLEEIIEPISTEKQINTTLPYGNSLNQIEMLNGVCLHEKGFTGTAISIAVFDAGFAKSNLHTAFDSLRNNNRLLGTKDFTFLNPINVFDPSTSGHGTAVLGTMAGYSPGNLVGTAPSANYWLIRSEYAPNEFLIEEYNWAAAAEFADSVGADIINSSLGYSTFDDVTQNHSMQDLNGKTSVCSKAALNCARKGMIVCSSAGNSGGSSWPKVGFPADADSIITIGAVDANQSIVGFSSVGPTSDGRIKPDVMAQGLASVVANSNGAIGTSSGTSFSSPILAGMVACLWQSNPTKKNMEIIDAIRKSSNMADSPNNQYGYGIPDFCKADQLLKGMVEINLGNEIVFYSSNPFNEKCVIYFPNEIKNAYIEVVDVNGKLLLNESINQSQNLNYFKEINMINSSNGVYFLRIYNDNSKSDELFSKKIVKIN
jgi:subtilisin family serine protease